MKRRRSSSGKTPKAKKFKPNKPDDGITRKVGFYGRYGRQARLRGLQPELKFWDVSVSQSLPATGAIFQQLCLIPQGDTESSRDGRKAYIKSIQFHGTLQYIPGASTNGRDADYIYLVLDTQCNGAAAAITDIFTSASLNTAMLQLNNSGRFRILKSWQYAFNAQAGVSTSFANNIRIINYYKKCNIPIDWNSTTGALTEIRSNNIFLCGGALQDAVTSLSGTCRLRFQG